MSRFIKPSVKWIKPVEVGFVIIAWVAGAAFGILAWHTPPTPKPVVDTRALISSKASFTQVKANFEGKPYAQGQFQELPGFFCEGWTNGANGHGWVVLRCSK
jgi:hypothetical protein